MSMAASEFEPGDSVYVIPWQEKGSVELCLYTYAEVRLNSGRMIQCSYHNMKVLRKNGV